MKKKKIQIYDYIFDVEVSDENEPIGSRMHMRGRLPADITEEELKQGKIYQHELFDGILQWLLHRDRMIILPTHNILVTVTDVIYDGSVRYGGGTITSCLKETCPHCQDTDCDFDCMEAQEWASSRDIEDQVDNNDELASSRNYNFACDAIEAMVLGHAIAGVNIESDAYLEGLESAIDSVANNI